MAKTNYTVTAEEISSEIWFIALSYPSLSSLLGRAVRRGVVLQFIHTFIDRACSTLFRTEGEHDIAGRAVATTHKTGTHKHHSTGDGCAGLSERSASRRDPILRLKLNGRIEFP